MKDKKDYIIEALSQQVADLQLKLLNLYADAKAKIDELEAKCSDSPPSPK